MERGLAPLLILVACGGNPAPASDPPDASAAATRGFEPPVALNAEPPVRYPPALFDQKVEGTVVLRLFIDETGEVVADSTRVAEGSGYDELDSAAVAAVPDLRFAPARRNGTPVATTFLQPVHFRHPDGASPQGGI